ncbi:AAA ATPase midasin, partial [Thoreauomyces humboldtii]
MNPGGDYGKKELSPALRNRFCEIWVPGVTGRGDLDGLVAKKLSVGGIDGDMSSTASKWMMDFYDWFAARLRKPRDAIVSLRDVLAWVEFVVGLAGRKVMDIEHAFVHGGCMVVVDGIGVNPAFGVVSGVEGVRREVRAALLEICGRSEEKDEFEDGVEVVDHPATFGVHPFFIAKGPSPVKEVQFSFMAPTTLRNLSRVLRALQLIKPILLEGSPGVGKTSLVTTLAHLTGHNLTRINLSEQTDLTDLFGTDLPVEGTGNAGRFAWRDGPFLNAMKKGEWVLLDELNLASQQVLEGLNACLDHRGEIYIPELDRVFQKGTGFRVFAAQNPQGQGGGRKGLPRSFVNRFTSVYVEALSEADVSRIITNIFGAGMEASTIEQMVRFNERMKEETMEKMRFGTRGGPWEFNLRDVVRWVELVKTSGDPRQYLEMMYAQRMRSVPDRVKVRDLFDEVFGASNSELRRPQWWVTEKRVMIGCGQMERKSNRGGPGMHGSVPIDRLHILPSMLPTLETLLKCVEMNYMPILTGPAGSGKTSLVRTLAGLCGVTLKEFSMNPGVDSVELLGGFEQADTVRRCKAVVDAIGRIVECTVRELIVTAQEEGIRIGSRVVTEWDGVVRAFDAESEASRVDSFVDQLEVVVEQLGLDLSGHSLPSFQQVRILTSSYKDAVAHGTQGTFEWVDGTLIKAMEEGHWILLDNVNLCPASVLDRLNPLLESGGVLNVTERGLDASGEVHIVGTRPGFRIFMCLDDRFGEVSRAMRNRGVEVFVDGTMSGTNEDTGRVVGGGSLAAVVEKSLAVPSQVSPPALVGVTEIRNMRMYARLLAERIERGDRLQDAVKSSIRDVYGQRDVPTLELSSNEEGRILASVFAAPMLSPQFASGRVILDESRLARVVMDGAYLQYITLQRANTPLRPKLIAAAIKTFIEGATTEDFSLRRSWILLLKRNLRKDDHEARDALENLLAVFGVNDNDWITSLEQIRDRLCAASGIDSTLVQGLPYDLRLVETSSLLKLRQAEEWSSYVTVMRTRALSSRLQKMAHQESQIGSSGVPGSRAAVTVLAASRMHASFRIGETELEHPCVATFWPLVEGLRCAVAGWVSAVDVAAYFDAIQSLLDARDRFWACLQAAELPFEDTFVALRRLRKALALCPQYNNDEDASNLRSLVDRAAQQIGLNSFGGAAVSLWKHGSVTVLKRTDLFDIERDFAAVNASLNVWNGPMSSQQQPSAGAEPDASTEDIFWGGMGHPAAVPDRLVKQSVVEGVATLYYLNEGADAGAAGADQEGDLVTVLADVPKRMMIAVAKTAADNMEDARVIRAGGIQEGASLVEVVPRVPMMIVNRYADRAATLSGWALVEAAALKAELGVLRKLGGLVVEQAGQLKLCKLVHELTALHTTALQETSRPPLDLEPLQRLIWVCDSSKKDSEAMSSFVKVVLLDGMYRWHRALWSNATAFWAEAMDDEVNAAPLLDCAVLDTLRGTTEIKPTEHRCGGPAILERGVSSRFALRFSMPMDRVPTYAHPAKKEQLLGLVRYLTSERYEAALGDGAADDMGMLTVVLHQFLESHQKAFEPEVYAEIISGARQLREFAQGRVGDAQVVVQEMMKQFSNSRSEIVSSRLRVYLGPGLIALADILSGREDSAAQRGKFWMCYSIAFLRSYIPEVPIDPASGPAVKLKFMKDDADGVRSEIHVREEIERMLTGNKDNSLIRELLTRVERIEARGKNWTSRVALRPARSQIRKILNDLKLLGGHLLRDEAVNGLMQTLDGGRNNDVAANQEAHLQDTLAALVVRLETKYPLYRDVLQPVYLAVYQFKYGLRLLAGSNVERANHGTQADVEKLLTAAVRFVDDGRMEGLETVLPRVKGFAGTPVQLQIIFGLLSRMHASIQVRGAVRPDTLGPVHVLFGSLVDAWAEAEQARIDKEKAEANLYKYKERTHDVLNENEIDEEQFREQFPDFYADFNDVLPSAPADQKAAKTTLEEPREKKEAPAVSVEIAQEIRLLHRGIVDSWIAGASSLLNNDTIENSWKKAFKRSYTCAGELLRSCSLCPSQKLDHDGRGGYLFMATEQLRTLTVSSADEHGTPGLSAGARYDFYRDANVAEARRIHEILSALDARLGELLAQWPEHSVLLQLAMLCERITSFSITSPVMKLLTGLEIVIQKCQDWEPYASRDVSLKPHIEAITGLIVRWRKLELRSWRELLEVEDRRSEQAASALWFHLWKVVVGIAVQGTDNTDENLESESIQ